MALAPADQPAVFTGTLDAVPVVEAATTSRVAIDNATARVVVFSFDAGEQLTEHTATVPVVVQLVTGRMRFNVAGTDHELAAGDLVYLPPNEVHALEAHEPSHLALTMLRGGSG